MSSPQQPLSHGQQRTCDDASAKASSDPAVVAVAPPVLRQASFGTRKLCGMIVLAVLSNILLMKCAYVRFRLPFLYIKSPLCQAIFKLPICSIHPDFTATHKITFYSMYTDLLLLENKKQTVFHESMLLLSLYTVHLIFFCRSLKGTLDGIAKQPAVQKMQVLYQQTKSR